MAEPIELVDAPEQRPTREKGGGKIREIVALHREGKTKKEIVEMGYHKTTVSIQIAAYEKDPAAWKKKYNVD